MLYKNRTKSNLNNVAILKQSIDYMLLLKARSLFQIAETFQESKKSSKIGLFDIRRLRKKNVARKEQKKNDSVAKLICNSSPLYP